MPTRAARPLSALAALALAALGGLLGAYTRPPRPAPAQTTRPQALTHVTLIDGTGAPPRADMTVVVRDRHVADLFPSGAKPLPSDAEVIDLRGKYLIPGLIDAHVHLGTQARPPEMSRGVLRSVFLGGVTTVRDMGGSVAIVPPLARWTAHDTADAPRIFYSAIVAGSGRWFEGAFGALAAAEGAVGASPLARRVNASTDVAAVIRAAKAAGATGIKVYDDVAPPLLRQLVAESHARGLRAWSHLAVDPSRPSDVLAAGVDVVSHADQFRAERGAARPSGVSDSVWRAQRRVVNARVSPQDSDMTRLITQMRARGTMLDPTLFVMLSFVPRTPDSRAEGGAAAFATLHFAAAMTRRAHAAGVPIVAGTDGIGGSSANLHAELQLLVDSAGLSPLAALRAATLNAATAIGAQDSLGSVATGKLADLVVLTADPSVDVANTQRVYAVMKSGRLVVRTTPVRLGPFAREPVVRH